MLALFVLGLVLFALVIVLAATGVGALLLGRMPGQWLQRRVRQPRLWGAGAVLMVTGFSLNSLPPAVVGAGLVVLGHVVKSPR